MARVHWKKYVLRFKQPGGTSRGVLHEKPSWFLVDDDRNFLYPALGECSIIPGLSPDNLSDIEDILDEVCNHFNGNGELPDLCHFPAVAFGLEMLMRDREVNGSKEFFPGAFTLGSEGLPTNGLIWMGTPAAMKTQVRSKVEQGFTCLKLKIGAIDFREELSLLRWIREEFHGESLELRVDANGAFSPDEALEKLKHLSDFDLHSIEQPVRPGQWDVMAELCAKTPVPIALDEELIGLCDPLDQEQMLRTIAPQFIVLKPSLVGGWAASDRWISAARSRNIGWWITSALESNVGLSAIAQYTSTKKISMPQGLGTGGLYENNFDSPLYLHRQFLHWNTIEKWTLIPFAT